jgi:hypothetical protein
MSATGFEPVTEEIILTRSSRDGAIPAPSGGPGDPLSDALGDDDDEWPERGPRKGIRMPIPTVLLFAVLIGAGGLWGGAALQRSHGSTSASSATSPFAALRGGGAGGLSGLGGTGALGGATTGTVTSVSGSTLYVTNSSGNLVKVTVGPSATVNRNAKSSLGALQVGDTVVVQGSKTSNGSVTATSVSATGAGVSSGFPGFGSGASEGTGSGSGG